MTAEEVPDHIAEARQQLFELTNAYWQTQVVYVLAKLAIPDLLADGPRDVQSLAAAAHAHAPSLGRLLRSVASLGLVSETEPGVFCSTPKGELLRRDVPGSLRYLVLMNGEDWHWRPWEQLAYSVQTGNPAFDRTFGMGAFEFFSTHAAAGEVFNGCMTNYSHMEMNAITAAYDFTRFETIVDIAGGHGSLLTAILRQAPDARGVLFDLPEVIAGARERVLEVGMRDRCELVAGSFFEAVPAGDLLMMKHIIHDWDDEHSCQILQHCRRSIADSGTLLLFEMVLPATTDEPHPARFLDMEMLVMTRGGRERTENEFGLLLADCGFRLTRVVPTQAPVCVIEAKPV
ncbi:MAG TPA: methyltransferase [Planctomycetaceae bacterium]|nr:methyltransferase [Planctomycetaceae bacterium]